MARLLGSCVALGVSLFAGDVLSQEGTRPPNFVLILLDDAGWSDLRPFGTPAYKTPNVERLARQGRTYHNFYVPQAVCSASRAALLTGSYPGRTRAFGAYVPRERGLDPSFVTIAEVLETSGYRTAVFGKWHLGDEPDTRPPSRGFDESAGLMYSNDMWELHPGDPEFWGRWPLQFWENGEITIEKVTQDHQPLLTRWYTERAVDFIQRHAGEPFFLYLPHSMPHVPLYASEAFLGRSGTGLYGDVMMELDWSVGEVLDALARAGVADDTLVLLTSDNGPWLSYGDHAGSTPFREGKRTGFDGGIRSPLVAAFPGRIPPGTTSSAAFSSIDILPTLAHLAGARLPVEPIDGRNVWDLVAGKGSASNPHEYYPFSTGRAFEGVISGDGRWKLHLPHDYQTLASAGSGGRPGNYEKRSIGLSLFDLREDPTETTNILDAHPEIARRLKSLAEQHRSRFYPEPGAE